VILEQLGISDITPQVAGGSDARQRHAQGRRIKKMVTPAARREVVAHLQVAYEVSERRSCSAIGADRTSVRYRSRRPDDATVRARLRELASFAGGSVFGGYRSC
jgi:hypothetical protein